MQLYKMIEDWEEQKFTDDYYKLIDELWETINHRNGIVPIQEGAYIGLTGIPFFNEKVIREVINNAFAHRDYRRASEIVIKMYPHRIDIVNAGGFPQGVTLDNLLTVSSTPRNRLLADVLSKTGIVERSGQGVDKIFFHTLAEGKPQPDYRRLWMHGAAAAHVRQGEALLSHCFPLLRTSRTLALPRAFAAVSEKAQARFCS